MSDSSERRRLLEELKVVVKRLDETLPVISAEGIFSIMITHAPVGMLLVGQDGKIIVSNMVLEDLFGWERNGLCGQYVEVLVPDAIRGPHIDWRDTFIKGVSKRYLRTVMGTRKDGSEIPVEVGLQTVQAGENLRFVIVVVADRGDPDVSTNTRATSDMQC